MYTRRCCRNENRQPKSNVDESWWVTIMIDSYSIEMCFLFNWIQRGFFIYQGMKGCYLFFMNGIERRQVGNLENYNLRPPRTLLIVYVGPPLRCFRSPRVPGRPPRAAWAPPTPHGRRNDPLNDRQDSSKRIQQRRIFRSSIGSAGSNQFQSFKLNNCFTKINSISIKTNQIYRTKQRFQSTLSVDQMTTNA